MEYPEFEKSFNNQLKSDQKSLVTTLDIKYSIFNKRRAHKFSKNF